MARLVALSEEVVGVLKRELHPGGANLHEPRFEGRELQYVEEAIRSTFVSSVGKFVDRFEAELAAVTGARRAVAVCNGTAALHVCLILAGVEHDDEVLIPTLTFVATANAILYCSAIPHFVDSESSSFGVDARKLEAHLTKIAEIRSGQCFNRETGRRIRALMPMHAFGHPAQLDELTSLAQRFCLTLIEDAAESLGSTYKGLHTGKHGLLSAISFNGNKIVTSGGGGAILTDDDELGKLAKHLTTTAKLPHPWAFVHDRMGYNYRMPNLNAALACAQLEQLPSFLERKRALATRYSRAFGEIEGIRMLSEPSYGKSNYWLNVLLLDTAEAAQRDSLIEACVKNGFGARPVWTLMHKLPFLKNYPRMNLDCAEDLESRAVCLPSSYFL